MMPGWERAAACPAFPNAWRPSSALLLIPILVSVAQRSLDEGLDI